MAAPEESEWEAWMVETLSLYDDLHVFELQEATRVLEWIHKTGVCVAGYGSGRRNEILQLALPQKLSAKQKQGLCPDRDFRVDGGGFSHRPVYQLKHVPGTSLLVTSGPPDTSLQVWTLGASESDSVRLQSSWPLTGPAGNGWSRLSVTGPPSPRVLHGSTLTDLSLLDLHTRTELPTAAPTGLDAGESVSGLALLDGCTFLVCTESGRLGIGDTRQCPALTSPPSPAAGAGRWTMALEPGGTAVARLSSSGQLVLTDRRDLSTALARAQMDITQTPDNADHLCLTWAPHLRHHLAVSGFDGSVRVYDAARWSESPVRAEPVIVHRGHGLGTGSERPLVTAHTWVPGHQRALLSAATDGSLHLWGWAGGRGA
ncbi:WD repeat-containing protein 73 [Amblyraja radiata]|uniref:WD repeat-containing protein 73 n=1 Tax=Amblyraja radiata TaxID=386614 RepID=UPI001403CECC|nr:WD repeat-containing protein 73 [Amblyraja radiata]